MRRLLLSLLAVVVLAGLAGGGWWFLVEVPGQESAAARPSGRPGAGMPVPVETVPVTIAPAETTVTAVGTLASNESSILRPEIAGRIIKIQFEEGAAVKRGQILLKLDDDVETAELARAESAATLARANLERATELRRSNAGTQRALDEAEAESLRTRAEVALANAVLARKWLKSAFDAQAGLRLFSLGDYVEVGQDLVNLEQIDPLKVDFRVPEVFLASLAAGQKVRITVDAFAGETFEGEVFAINPLIDEAGRAVVIRARVANAGERLRPGLFARVTLTLAERAEAMWVPEGALTPEGSEHFLFKVEPGVDGKPPTARRTAVSIGKRLPGKVEITAGLEPEDSVVVAGTVRLRDGATLAPREMPPTAVPATAAVATGAS